ncbi:hypothetical protein NFJ02_33g84880 [Pycnococcus provasolii]
MAEGLLEDFMRSSSWAGDASVSSTTTTTTTTFTVGNRRRRRRSRRSLRCLPTHQPTAACRLQTQRRAAQHLPPQVLTSDLRYKRSQSATRSGIDFARTAAVKTTATLATTRMRGLCIRGT